jgi:hypothetical protein
MPNLPCDGILTYEPLRLPQTPGRSSANWSRCLNSPRNSPAFAIRARPSPGPQLMGVRKKLLTPSVLASVVKQVNQKRITNSKDLRKRHAILPYPVARAYFLNDEGNTRLSRAAPRAT